MVVLRICGEWRVYFWLDGALVRAEDLAIE